MNKHHPEEPDDAKPILPADEQEQASSNHHDDIADFTRNVRTAWDKFGMNTVLVILLAILSFMIFRFFTGREERTLEQAYSELSQSTNPAGKQEIAFKYESSLPHFAAGAYLESADLQLREATFGLSPKSDIAEHNKMLSDKERQDLLQRAAADYQHVLEIPDHTLLQSTAARFGLAAVFESQQQFEKAGEQYRAIEKVAASQYPAVAAQATRMLADLDRVSKPVIFPPPVVKTESFKPSGLFSDPTIGPTPPVTPTTPDPTKESTPKSDAPKTDAPATPAPKADAPAPSK